MGCRIPPVRFFIRDAETIRDDPSKSSARVSQARFSWRVPSRTAAFPARATAPPSSRRIQFLRENVARDRSAGPFCREFAVAIALTARVRHAQYQAPTRPGASTKHQVRRGRQDGLQTRTEARTRRRRDRSCTRLSWGACDRCELDTKSRPSCCQWSPAKHEARKARTAPSAAADSNEGADSPLPRRQLRASPVGRSQVDEELAKKSHMFAEAA